jgi:hypothetical protein
MGATDRGLLETRYYGCCVVDLYNQRRRHSTLGQISPAAYERVNEEGMDAVENPTERGFPPRPHPSGFSQREARRTDQTT